MESDAAKGQIYHIGNREEINMDLSDDLYRWFDGILWSLRTG